MNQHKKQPCTITADDCNRIKVELMSALSGLFVYADTVSVTAANQLLRTNVDPKIYNTVVRLNRYIDKNPKRIRLLAEKIGYADFFSAEAQQITSSIIEVYQESAQYHFEATDITREDLAVCYIELLSIVALYNDSLMKDFAIAVFAILAHEYIHTHTQVFHHPINAETRSLTQLQDVLQNVVRHDQRFYYVPQMLYQDHDDSIEPIHAHVHHRNALTAFRLPLAVTLHDVFSDSYTIAYSDPYPVERYYVRDRVHVPLEKVMDSGLSMQLTFHVKNVSRPVQFFLNTDLLSTIRDHGSAVGVVIGMHGDIQLHPEYLHQNHHEDPIARVRVNHAVLEFQKLHPETDLTLFV